MWKKKLRNNCIYHLFSGWYLLFQNDEYKSYNYFHNHIVARNFSFIIEEKIDKKGERRERGLGDWGRRKENVHFTISKDRRCFY